MNEDLYKTYLKVQKPRWPTFDLWSSLMVWSVVLAFSLSGIFQYIVIGNSGWMLICIVCSLWALFSIYHWSKMLASKSTYDKLQKEVPLTSEAIVPHPAPQGKDTPLVSYDGKGPVIGSNEEYWMNNE